MVSKVLVAFVTFLVVAMAFELEDEVDGEIEIEFIGLDGDDRETEGRWSVVVVGG